MKCPETCEACAGDGSRRIPRGVHFRTLDHYIRSEVYPIGLEHLVTECPSILTGLSAARLSAMGSCLSSPAPALMLQDVWQRRC